MNFTIISDIHLNETNNPDWNTIIKDSNEILILAGDIGRIEEPYLIPFLDKLCKESHFHKIIYVLGNHEYYTKIGIPFNQLFIKFYSETEKYRPKFVILDNEYIDISKPRPRLLADADSTNLRIFGTTLWSQVPNFYAITLPIVTENGTNVNYNWFSKKHFDALCSLDYIIEKSQKDKKRLIVVSHYSPTFGENQNLTLKPDHYSSPYRFAYCSELKDYLSKNKVYTWIYGHTHVDVDFLTVGDTRLVTNQYCGTNFSTKVIRIKDEFKNYNF